MDLALVVSGMDSATGAEGEGALDRTGAARVSGAAGKDGETGRGFAALFVSGFAGPFAAHDQICAHDGAIPSCAGATVSVGEVAGVAVAVFLQASALAWRLAGRLAGLADCLFEMAGCVLEIRVFVGNRAPFAPAQGQFATRLTLAIP